MSDQGNTGSSFGKKTGFMDDPVAKSTEWTPARRGGTNFKAEKITVRGDRIVIGKTLQFTLLSLLIALIGLGVLSGVPFIYRKDGLFGSAILGVVGMTFSLVGFVMLFMPRTFTFDRMKGVFFKGRRYRLDDTSGTQPQGSIRDIHAIQVIGEHIQSKNGFYISYEVNLVLKDGQRINVMDHGNREALLKSVGTLQDFLGVPVWDATDNPSK